MPATAIVGANWGDEGKGKVTDYLAAEADVVVRFQGGRNAGHTIINEYGKFALHLLPSGVFRPDVDNVLGPGTAVDIAAFLAELDMLRERGVPAPRVWVSERAEVVMPYHVLFDRYEEERLGASGFGSTRSGIAPFYGDKYLKIGFQVADLYDRHRLEDRVARVLAQKNVLLKHLYAKPPMEPTEVVSELLGLAERLKPYMRNTTALLREAHASGKRILLEGQLGALRDPDHGIYPFSTSSSTLAGFGAVGAGVPPWSITRVVAVTKAYSTCVGAGPFVTQLSGSAADELRSRGGDAGEFGATTGRPRRVGWFDAVATRYGAWVQGATELVVTNLDVLGYLDEIPVCTGYRIGDTVTGEFPVTRLLDEATPVFETLPGWGCDIRGARGYEDLPGEARAYVKRIEELVKTPVSIVSTGPAREATIHVPR